MGDERQVLQYVSAEDSVKYRVYHKHCGELGLLVGFYFDAETGEPSVIVDRNQGWKQEGWWFKFCAFVEEPVSGNIHKRGKRL